MGLNHLNGRVQDAGIGRFMAPDPVGTALGSTQSWNRYSYVRNNPLTYSDPSGLSPCFPTFTQVETGGFDDDGLPFVGFFTAPGPEFCLPDPPPVYPAIPIGNPNGPGSPQPIRGPEHRPRSPSNPITPPASGENSGSQQTTPCMTGQTSSGANSSVGPVLAPLPGSVSGSDVLNTLGGLNDLADAGATLINAAGRSATGVAGTVSRVAPFVAAPISGLTLGEGLQTGNSQQIFDGSYGLTTTLLVAPLAPEVALGMALGKVLGDLATPSQNDPNILEEAALAAPQQTCPAGK